METSKIVAGFDKNRSDNSIHLWDVNTQTLGDNGPLRSVMEYGLSDTTFSLSWLRSSGKIFAAGMNNKSIRLLDTRGTINLNIFHDIC